MKQIKTALVSVFHKDGLDELLKKLNDEGVHFLSTGGTQQFIESLGYECQKVEDLTTYPSILGGRVKTLHPKVFGGILARRDNEGDREQMKQYDIPEIDLVIVNLYPFEQTVASGAVEQDIIEKIDIGGISLIRAAAKNFNDVVIVPSKAEYPMLLDILKSQGACTTREQRKAFAEKAFGVSSHYDTAIHNWFTSNLE
ncbi:MAG: IMP cyclohydrolase [Prevotella sp.]|nr:IMP cyclohydrolase [Prevotella sp.]